MLMKKRQKIKFIVQSSLHTRWYHQTSSVLQRPRRGSYPGQQTSGDGEHIPIVKVRTLRLVHQLAHNTDIVLQQSAPNLGLQEIQEIAYVWRSVLQINHEVIDLALTDNVPTYVRV